VVAQGWTVPRGVDASSGQRVHTVDFGSYRGSGTGFTLTADGGTSYPFDISAAPYERLSRDSLKFYYPQRSGIAVRDDLRPGYGRPAGHIGRAPNKGDTSVPCAPGGCGYRLDVTGGWYDAGDQGKYVVNGGISVWEMMRTYERELHAPGRRPQHLGDRTLDLPESGNGVPDILDEARWEMEFLLRMQVPAGRSLAGMVHHKVHDARWTGLPQLPDRDREQRLLSPPSTEATLNLAATAAQAARLFRPYDRAFADRALRASRAAWTAALAHPALHADPRDSEGGGAYPDRHADDEFYWAAAELYLTTGEKQFADRVLRSRENTAAVFGPLGFDWSRTAAAGRLDLATVPNALPAAERDRVRRSVLTAADGYLATERAQPYGLPYAPPKGAFDWGSNAQVLNNAQVVATAYDLTGERKYRDGALESMDYILGRNAPGISYVTGYGEHAAHNQHSRWYAHQIDHRLPNPPPGTLAGGPNSAVQDPVARRRRSGCVGQLCYIDDIQSWSTNELAVNWNAALVWMASFSADQS
jgi:endoglucanase